MKREGVGPARSGWWDAAALGLLAALSVAFFWKIALTNRVLAGVDVLSYFYPYRDYVNSALLAGRLPLWNPHLFMGAPLLANSQAAVLYPLNWPLAWLSAPKQVAWSIVGHIWLAGAGTYLVVRRMLPGQRTAALAAAAVLCLGGFLGAQVEHVNQLNASAWLPWLVLCLEVALGSRQRWPAVLAGGAAAAMALLAGHTQAAYIALAGAALWGLVRGWDESGQGEGSSGRRRWLSRLRGVGLVAAMAGIGGLLAAGQLVPTLELSRLSVRGGGLPYEEAASFSLKPGLVLKAFLPPLLWQPPFSEFVAYVGIVGLAAATVGAWAALRRKKGAEGRDEEAARRLGRPAAALAVVGAFLAFGAYNPVYYLLYRSVPGFDLFRVPARWLLLYAFGAAVLAGIGVGVVARGRGRSPSVAPPEGRQGTAQPGPRRWAPAAAVALIAAELFVAGRQLAYNRPTAPAAWESMRSAPAHLLAAAPEGTTTGSGAQARFLSLSDIGYDPGDMGDLEATFGPYLSEEEVYDLVVASKMKEVLAYDLPLGYRMPTVDGYDGGLLPTARYVTLERLFLPAEEIWPDGRLRQQLHEIPPERLLSLLNVGQVVTDKLQDAWVDDVYYDLEHTAWPGEVTLSGLPDLEATHLGVASYLTGCAELTDGTPVAEVAVRATDGRVVTATLRAGEDTAEGLYGQQPTAHRQARVAHQWRGRPEGSDYVTVVDLGGAMRPESVTVQSLLPGDGGNVALRGLTLIDDRTGTHRSASVSADFRPVHSGDVKIYENVGVQPRAFVAFGAQQAGDDEAALAVLRDADFDVEREAILAEGKPLTDGGGTANVEMTSYEPERVEIQAALDAPGYLVLTDAFYPGWQAHVDGQPARIERADIYFRAVYLEPGEHEVTFRYRPTSVGVGLAAGVAAWAVWAVLLGIGLVRAGRKRVNRL